jgi:transcriptional regulator GlxA family with amidase domain
VRTSVAILFPGVEVPYVFGPLEMFGILAEEFELRMVEEFGGPLSNGMDSQTVIDDQFSDGRQYDILLVQGGPNTRQGVNNASLYQWLKRQAENAELVTSVCTGSAVLAAARLLNGKRQTNNKNAFAWAASNGPHVPWQKQAYWVRDGKFFTSSGVFAGMDMSLGIIAHLLGEIQLAPGFGPGSVRIV